MNSEKRLELQEKCLQALQEKIDLLEAENARLRSNEQILSSKLSVYETTSDEAEKLRAHYFDAIVEISALKKEYQRVIRNIRLIQKEYEKSMERLFEK